MTNDMIRVFSIPHNEQRYPTCGDWEFTIKDTLVVTVSQSGNKDTDVLVAIHEIIESYLCQANGIPEASVTAWDLAHSEHPDPGSIPGCVYYREHMFATMIERLVAAELQVDWNEHEMRLENL